MWLSLFVFITEALKDKTPFFSFSNNSIQKPLDRTKHGRYLQVGTEAQCGWDIGAQAR